jgi:Siphovirus-type tail component, C-terminal domain
MLESIYLIGNDGSYIELNNDVMPLTEFSTEVQMRGDENERSQEDGLWEGYQYFGKRTIRAEGQILCKTSGEYIQLRKQLMKVIRPSPRAGYKTVGTLYMEFTGLGERVTAQVAIEGYPDMPMQALSPARGPVMLSFKAYDPILYGELTNSITVNMVLNAPGRAYSKTFDRSYPAGVLVGTGVNAFNAGNFRAFPQVRLNGPLTNPTLTLRLGTVQFAWFMTYAIAAGDYVDVDFRYRTVLSSSAANLYNATVGSTWWNLRPDENVITLTATSGTGNAVVSWKNAYML